MPSVVHGHRDGCIRHRSPLSRPRAAINPAAQPPCARSHPQLHVFAVGNFTESIARFFGTGSYLLIQTIVVIVWILLNIFAVRLPGNWRRAVLYCCTASL